MGWLYVPGLTGSDSLSDSSCRRIAQSVTWREKLRRPRFWRRAWRTVRWLKRLSGMTLPPSTAGRGVASWISSLRASRASHGPAPASARDARTSDRSGPTSPVSSGRSSRPSCSLKTFPDSGPMASLLSRMTSGRQGTLFPIPCSPRRLTLVLPSGGCGSGPWPTCAEMDSVCSGSAGYSTSSGRHSGTTQTDAVRMWATCTAADGKRTGPNSRYGNGALHQSAQIARFHRAATRNTGAESPPKINPRFREWLMGWPIGWSAYEPLEPGSFRSWRRLHSSYLRRWLLERKVQGE